MILSISRKAPRAVAVFILLAVCLTMCCGSAFGDEAEKPVTLRVSWWGNQVRNDNTVNALNKYTEDHPNVTFEFEFSDWGGYWDKLAAQAASSSLPDIVQMDYAYIMQYKNKDQIVNLDPYIQDGVIDISNISDAILAPASIGGSLYGISAGLTLTTMQYDKALVEKAGVSIGNQITWEDYFAYSEIIYDATGVKAYFPAERKMLEIMARSIGEELFDVEAHEIGLSSDELLVKFFTLVKEASTASWHVSPEVLVEKNVSSIETHPLVDSTVWASFFQTNQAPTMQSTAARELGVTMYPQLPDAKSVGVNLGTSSWWCISDNSKNKDISAVVIDYLTNSEKSRDALGVERGIPSSTAMADYIKPTLTVMEQEIVDLTNEVAKTAKSAGSTPAGSSEFDALLRDLIDQVRYNEISPEAAAEQLMSEGNDILRRAAE